MFLQVFDHNKRRCDFLERPGRLDVLSKGLLLAEDEAEPWRQMGVYFQDYFSAGYGERLNSLGAVRTKLTTVLLDSTEPLKSSILFLVPHRIGFGFGHSGIAPLFGDPTTPSECPTSPIARHLTCSKFAMTTYLIAFHHSILLTHSKSA